MTKSVIKICNFVHYFFREGGYLYCDKFLLFMVGGGVQREIGPNSLFSLFFFWQASLTHYCFWFIADWVDIRIMNPTQWHQVQLAQRQSLDQWQKIGLFFLTLPTVSVIKISSSAHLRYGDLRELNLWKNLDFILLKKDDASNMKQLLKENLPPFLLVP